MRNRITAGWTRAGWDLTIGSFGAFVYEDAGLTRVFDGNSISGPATSVGDSVRVN